MRNSILLMKINPRLLSLLIPGVLGLTIVLRAEDTPPAPPPVPAAPAAPADAPRHERGDRMQKMRQHMIKELGLTAEQQTKWSDIDRQQKAAMDQVAPGDRRAKGREIMQQSDAQRRAVLTPEQQTKFDELRAKQKQHRKNQGEGRDGPPPPPEAK